MNDDLNEVLENCVNKIGVEKTKEALVNLVSDVDEKILTIIVNTGVHEIPKKYLHGEIYPASHGNIDFSSQENIILSYKTILSDLVKKLYEKPWTKIYLIPTGHVTLSLQIKLFVYHILRIDTIDLFYQKGEYFELSIYHRDVILSNKN